MLVSQVLIKGARKMDEILEILEKDGRASVEDIAKMIHKKPLDVKKAIKQYEKEGAILKYKAVINKDLIRDTESEVRALIEVNIVPQKDLGFEKIAQRIYSFSEVTSCYLISGTYDLLVVVEGKNLHTVSNFVAEKLSCLENVRGTATHFLLKKYKEDGVILKQKPENKRIAISY
jgi:DNA-binding Lrp family transcriptional regulator